MILRENFINSRCFDSIDRQFSQLCLHLKENLKVYALNVKLSAEGLNRIGKEPKLILRFFFHE